MSLLMIPWVCHLATSLPDAALAAHSRIAWTGLDSGEAVAMFTTGSLLLREDRRCVLAATATCVLLCVDAWFDVTTAAPGPDLAEAVAMALGAELPLAAGCAALALRLLRTPAPLPHAADAGRVRIGARS